MAEVGVSADEVHRDVRIVQFLDKLSLYVCLSDPDAAHGPFVPWLQGGFAEAEPIVGAPVMAKWMGPGHVGLQPFPFRAAFTCEVPVRRVAKRAISSVGIAKAYERAPVERYRVTIAPG